MSGLIVTSIKVLKNTSKKFIILFEAYTESFKSYSHFHQSIENYKQVIDYIIILSLFMPVTNQQRR